MNWTKKFCAVGISINEQLVNKYPQYFFSGLHIHILDAVLINNYQSGESKLSLYTDDTLYQWGVRKQLEQHSRYPCVTESERRCYGNIGIGSAAAGGSEKLNQFCGGGEGFILQDQAFRVTIGGEAIPLSEADQYWFLQTCNFVNFNIKDGLSFSGNRQELDAFLKDKISSNSCAYMTTFECHILRENFLARSNGIYSHDVITKHKLAVFDNDMQTYGGHLLDVNDKISLNILSPIFIKPLTKINILSERILIDS